jgi:hypothetical protein
LTALERDGFATRFPSEPTVGTSLYPIMSLAPFDHQPRTRLIYGNGTLARVGELAREIGGRALVVSDPGIVGAGYVVRAVSFLSRSRPGSRLWRGA